jgi:hypothetical protein
LSFGVDVGFVRVGRALMPARLLTLTLFFDFGCVRRTLLSVTVDLGFCPSILVLH